MPNGKNGMDPSKKQTPDKMRLSVPGPARLAALRDLQNLPGLQYEPGTIGALRETTGHAKSRVQQAKVKPTLGGVATPPAQSLRGMDGGLIDLGKEIGGRHLAGPALQTREPIRNPIRGATRAAKAPGRARPRTLPDGTPTNLMLIPAGSCCSLLEF